MKLSHLRPRFRFTFFQRQFLSHLLLSMLILVLLAAGFTYYMKQRTFDNETEELASVSKGIVRLLAREGEDPTSALQAYRPLLAERRTSFILLDQAGEIAYRDPKMPGALRGKAFLDELRSHMSDAKDNESFIVERGAEKPWVVVYRQAKLKPQKTELHLFVFSPLHGIQETMEALNQALIYMIVVIFILAVAVSWIFSRSMSASIQSLRRTTRQIAAGDYAARSTVRRSDELGELAGDFNSMAQQLELALHKLQQFETRRRHFIMDVTHELRTPLTSIRGIIEGLKSNLVHSPEERANYYGIIEKETFRLIRLINGLLDMEKIESGLIALNKKRTPLKELFEIVHESLEVLIEEKRLHILIECEPDLLVYADYDRLMQILINLVKNSIQFTAYGTIRLTGSDTETHTMIVIEDTGRGMSKEELALIWERFYKSDPSRSKSNSETGLGLSIVKQLVEAHAGTIEADSTPGIGTLFTIALPKTDQAASKDGEAG
ncbi:ATP-binding protein [Paenibacillus elgii]